MGPQGSWAPSLGLSFLIRREGGLECSFSLRHSRERCGLARATPVHSSKRGPRCGGSARARHTLTQALPFPQRQGGTGGHVTRPCERGSQRRSQTSNPCRCQPRCSGDALGTWQPQHLRWVQPSPASGPPRSSERTGWVMIASGPPCKPHIAGPLSIPLSLFSEIHWKRPANGCLANRHLKWTSWSPSGSCQTIRTTAQPRHPIPF